MKIYFPLIMNLSFYISIIITLISALLAIAFYTLLERKALGYFQLRKGPNKVGIAGLPQPFADALKLFFKELNKPFQANLPAFIIAPILALILALLIWSLAPVSSPAYFLKYGVIAFLCVSRLSVYTTLGSGWSSNSKYALLGAIRRVAQTISYEVRIALILLSALIIHLSCNIRFFIIYQIIPIFFIAPPLFFIWFATTLAETNRTPFDLAEGESELVSGFNIEYRRGAFALIFIAEYARILIICFISASIFIFSPINSLITDLFILTQAFILAFTFLWIRASFPRIRYDQLISLTWKSFLPLALTFLIFFPAIPLLI